MKIISLVLGHWRLNQFGEAEIEISIKTVLSVLQHLKNCITKDKESQPFETYTSALGVACRVYTLLFAFSYC